jgi:hypothetical protein
MTGETEEWSTGGMNMDRDALWRDYVALPPEARKQVAEFMAFLAKRNVKTRAAPQRTKFPLGDEPFVGMWRDRADMIDSSAWVRSVRAREWTRTRG